MILASAAYARRAELEGITDPGEWEERYVA
jgi:hypothetical protein